MLKAVCAVALLLGLGLLPVVALAAPRPVPVTVRLSPSVPSPELLGTSVTWTATVIGGSPRNVYDYQFSVSYQGQNQIVRDFAPPNSFTWVPWNVEGNYTVSVVVRDITNQPYITYPPVPVPYTMNPIVTTPGGSAVTPTAHPLVALFSAGPCTIGHSIEVVFHETGSQTSMVTNAVPCSSTSANFLVAGMLPSTEYEMHWEEFATGFENNGPDLSFTTGRLPLDFPREGFQVNVPPSQHDAAFPLVFFQFLPAFGQPLIPLPTATDLNGNVLWYFPQTALVTRTEAGGNFFTITNTDLSEWDLAGNQLLDTNPEILNEQLVAKGYPPMTSFSTHETRRLPNGGIMVIAARDEVSTQYQGGTQQNPVDILGDMILILDHNMQVVWAWDAFAHQDLSREATLDDTCTRRSGCPLFNPEFSVANDWLHSNSVQLESDGNLVLSERDQDWVLKINYANGSGDGSIIWKLGPYGDFTLLNPVPTQCGDPAVYPWFSHQHDAAFYPQAGILKTFSVFDDGNTRVTECGGAGNSRGVVMYINEAARTAYMATLADLGAYSYALGSAQLMYSPLYPVYASFGNGLLSIPQQAVQATEVDTNGNIVYQLQGSFWSYRSYRMQDLYTPALP